MEEIWFFFFVCVWNAVIPYYTFIFVFSGLKYPVKPYEIITNLTIFPVSLCDDGYCAIFISTYSSKSRKRNRTGAWSTSG